MKLTVHNVAKVLWDAGETGITTTQVARLTDAEGRTWAYRSNRVNQNMRRLEKLGVVRAGELERQPDQYKQMPVRRWYRLPELEAYLARGTPEQQAEARRREQAELSEWVRANEQRRADLLAEARERYGPRTAHCRRKRVIRELREARLSLQEIATVFGLTRERVRQIQLHEQLCRCLWCRAAGSSGGEVVTLHRRVMSKSQ